LHGEATACSCVSARPAANSTSHTSRATPARDGPRNRSTNAASISGIGIPAMSLMFSAAPTRRATRRPSPVCAATPADSSRLLASSSTSPRPRMPSMVEHNRAWASLTRPTQRCVTPRLLSSRATLSRSPRSRQMARFRSNHLRRNRRSTLRILGSFRQQWLALPFALHRTYAFKTV